MFMLVCARLLGPAGQGLVAAVASWALLFGTLAHLSLGQVALHAGTQSHRHEWFARTLGTLASLAALLTVFAWFVAALLYLLPDSTLFRDIPTSLLVLGFLAVPLIVWEAYGSSLLMSIDRLDIYNRAQVIGKTLSIVFAVLFIEYAGLGAAGALAALLVSQAVTSTYGIALLIQSSPSKPVANLRTAVILISGGVKLHLNAIGAYLLSTINILVVLHYCGAEATGQYHLASQVMIGILAIPLAAQHVLYSKLTILGPTTLWRTQKPTIAITLGLVTAISLFMALLAEPLLTHVAGEGYRPATPILHILLLGSIPTSLSILMAAQWVGRGLFLQTSLLTFLAGCSTLLLSIVLTPRYGAQGAAWAVVVSAMGIPLIANVWMAIHAEKNLRTSKQTAEK